MPKEAQARIKINHLLEAAGWRFFHSQAGAANIALEPKVKCKRIYRPNLRHD
jgi:type I restriction enzyme, R subunit